MKELIDRATIPKLSDQVFYSSYNDRHLFLNTSIPDWIVVNQNAAWVLSQADGHLTVGDIIDRVVSDGGDGEEASSIISEAWLHDIFAKDPVDSTDTEECHYNNKQLRIVHMKLTNNCNLSCVYCYAESGSPSNILSFSELLDVASNVHKISPTAGYVLSGGEPLLHPHAIEFARHIKSLGHEVFLLTNGAPVTKKNASIIAESIHKARISIDGSTPEVHGITRSAPSLLGAMQAVDLLTKHGVDVSVAMVVHRKNMHDIPRMVERWGNRLIFEPLYKAGRGTTLDDLYISGKEYYEALAEIPTVNVMGKIGKTLKAARRKGIRSCAMGDSEISISNDGNVYPCQMLEDDEFLSGNIREKSLIDIYSNSTVLQQAAAISINSVVECRKCPIRLLCGGGCRARSFYETGDINRSGEFCEYERLAYVHGLIDNADFSNYD